MSTSNGKPARKSRRSRTTWSPGQSGNPAGRPPDPTARRRMAAATIHLPEEVWMWLVEHHGGTTTGAQAVLEAAHRAWLAEQAAAPVPPGPDPEALRHALWAAQRDLREARWTRSAQARVDRLTEELARAEADQSPEKNPR